MTLNRQIALSQLHQDQHLNNEPNLITDPCCPNCHPVQGEIPIGFRNYWTWLKSVIPVAHQFNSNTLEAYRVADQLRSILQNAPRITSQTQGIIKAYKNIT